MNDVMLDLETMGKGPNAAVIAIGAVEFDIEAKQLGERFYTAIDLESSIRRGGIMDASTVLWWMRQSDEARSAFAKEREDIQTALFAFTAWILKRRNREPLKIWGNGADFDNVILSSALQREKIAQPLLALLQVVF